MVNKLYFIKFPREFMRIIIFSIHIILFFACFPVQALEIANSGKSKYTIVIADSSSEAIKYSAEELSRFLCLVTGAKLPVISDKNLPGTCEIIIGNNNCSKDTDSYNDNRTLKGESYQIANIGSNITITGESDRGTLYGVYDFLERFCGVRWFMQNVSEINKIDRLEIPDNCNITYNPPFEYREAYIWEAFDGDWAARNRLNRNSKNGTLGEKHGGRVELVPGMFAHTFSKLVPAEKYFKNHPEYFSMIKGKRIKEDTQLCCTNQDVIDLISDEVIKLFEQNPKAEIISVSQNDCGNYCCCPKCKALSEKEGSPAAPMLYLVNAVSEKIQKDCPGKKIETLAYQWSRKPPKTLRPGDNVIIRLCTIECCFRHTLNDSTCAFNKEFADDLHKWGNISKHLWVWNYNTSFSYYLIPFPDLMTRGEDIKFLRDNHVTGIFQQDVYNTPNGELSPLSAYINARLLWNPDSNIEVIISEFLKGVYKEASEPIYDYIKLIHNSWQSPDSHLGIWQGPDADYLSDSALASIDSLWNAAEKKVKNNADVLDRVKTARLSPEYAIIVNMLNTGAACEINHDLLKITPNPDFLARFNNFCSTAERSGIKLLSEYNTTVPEFREQTLKKVTQNLTPFAPVKFSLKKTGLICKKYDSKIKTLSQIKGKKGSFPEETNDIKIPGRKDSTDVSYVFEGYLEIKKSGVYCFHLCSDGVSELAIGDSTIVRNSGADRYRKRCGFTALKSGFYPLKILFVAKKDRKTIDVSFSGPDFTRKAIPHECLYH